jgi:hypothetical protein
MEDMTAEEAQAEAVRRWGESGAIRTRQDTASTVRNGRGRLARYRFTVGNGYLGKACSVQGQGHTWREAFDDARPSATHGAPRAR